MTELKRCRLWVWKYVDNHPGQTHEQIADATNEWTSIQVLAALFTLMGTQRVEYKNEGYRVLVPFDEAQP